MNVWNTAAFFILYVYEVRRMTSIPRDALLGFEFALWQILEEILAHKIP